MATFRIKYFVLNIRHKFHYLGKEISVIEVFWLLLSKEWLSKFVCDNAIRDIKLKCQGMSKEYFILFFFMNLLFVLTWTTTRYSRVHITAPANADLPTRLSTNVRHHAQTPKEIKDGSWDRLHLCCWYMHLLDADSLTAAKLLIAHPSFILFCRDYEWH